MKISRDYRSEKSKLIRITIEAENNKIKYVEIHGDFFIYPEDSLKEIENSLKGLTLEENVIRQRLKALFDKMNIVAIGLSPEDLTKAIVGADS
ncbi:MAG TPA: lipoate--protein ligase family protein [Candidatus Bathyarchaeota archaeon]|nr:lipoate--protein ligase family protein [Candidatus Bathyarchaeota archaeon]